MASANKNIRVEEEEIDQRVDALRSDLLSKIDVKAPLDPKRYGLPFIEMHF